MKLIDLGKNSGYFCLNQECPSETLVFICLKCIAKGEDFIKQKLKIEVKN